jgi:hypothetical protein
MSEFKFSCPNCQQNIQATSEYSGLQINCPSCQTPLIVPTMPAAPAASAPPPAPLVPAVPAHAPRLSVAASTPHAAASAAAAAAFYGAVPVKKKKSKVGLIVGLSLGAVALGATIYFWPELMKKVSHGNQKLAAEELAPTNAPPPPPPELTTEEILEKVGDTYKGLTDYGAKGQTVCDLDMSALTPSQKTLRMTATSALQLGRTNNYRLEWEENIAGTPVKGAAWSSGKGNFVGYGPYPPGKVKNRQLALAPAEASFILSGSIAELFFAETNSFAALTKNFTKTNDTSLNVQDNYVLTGEVNHVGVIICVNKNTFLITQIEGILGKPVAEEEIRKLPSAQRTQVLKLSKIKGTITETYSSIQTNQNLQASAFETAYQPAAAATATARPKRASSRAGELTQPGGRRKRTSAADAAGVAP